MTGVASRRDGWRVSGSTPRLRPVSKSSSRRGFLLAVVTNQPDVGNGLVGRSEVDAMHEIITRELPVDTIKACFHRQVDDCNCRKPKPGMILEAATELGVDLTKSFMVGDRKSDVEGGR